MGPATAKMPRSKREKKVSLTQTDAKGSEHKQISRRTSGGAGGVRAGLRLFFCQLPHNTYEGYSHGLEGQQIFHGQEQSYGSCLWPVGRRRVSGQHGWPGKVADEVGRVGSSLHKSDTRRSGRVLC